MSLREELSSRYGEDSRAALSELANIKDKALDNANKRWEKEKDKLTKRVRLQKSRWNYGIHESIRFQSLSSTFRN